MENFITNYLGTVVVSAIIVLVCGMIIRKIIKNKKTGIHCCNSDCSHCNICNHDNCHCDH